MSLPKRLFASYLILVIFKVILLSFTIYIDNIKLINVWNKGPTKTWNDAKKNNIIKQIGSIDFSHGKGLSWGNYVFDI